MYAFLLELRRRSVFRVAGGYAVLTWLLIQLAMALETTLLMPGWFDTVITVTLLIGFPVALILAWAFEMTPEGFKRTESDPQIERRAQKLRIADGIIALSLLTLIGLSAWEMTDGGAGPVAAGPADSAAAAPAPDGQRSIAVLSFEAMTQDDQEYFSDGIAEEILNALGRIPELKVAGRTSAFAFRDSGATLQQIGEELGVEHILEGSVRKFEQQVRVTARLTETESGSNLWAQTYNDRLENVFDLQDKIARDVARELRLVLALPSGERLATELTDDPVAYDTFLRGRQLTNDAWGPETIPRAVAFLEEAVARDPGFVEAWEHLAFANFLLPTYAGVADEEPYLEAAHAAADRAIALKPTGALGHNVKASLRLAENKFAQSLRLTELAMLLEPNNSEIQYSKGYRLSVIGLNEAAQAPLDAALDDNPRYGLWLMAKGVALLNTGRTEEAEATGRKALAQGFGGGAFLVADAMLVRGEARAAYEFLMGVYDDVAYITPEFAAPELWELGGRALYLREPAAIAQVRDLVGAALADPETPVKSSVMSTILSLGDAELFMQAFAAHPYANGSYVLSRLWDGREATEAIRTHPGFPAWAEGIGLVATWQEFGWPDRCRADPGTDGTDGRFSCT